MSIWFRPMVNFRHKWKFAGSIVTGRCAKQLLVLPSASSFNTGMMKTVAPGNVQNTANSIERELPPVV